MIIALFIFIIYVGVAFFYGRELKSLKDQLVKANATSEDTAVPGELIKLHRLVAGILQFDWFPVKPTEDGFLWINVKQWQRLQTLAIALFVITLLTFIGLFLSYL